jgi:adenine/guanine phosphoribosyltransferase-like PRPP-binding protein
MALPEWMRVSVDAVSLARQLQQPGRQDLIDAIERGAISLGAAVAQASGKPSPGGLGDKGDT